MQHGSWHEQHCMAQGPVASVVTVDRHKQATLRLQADNDQ